MILRLDDHAAKIVFVLLLCAALMPVLLVPLPAMVDYPNHLARMYILSRVGTPDANPFYQTAWALYPNLAMDLAIPQIARLTGVEMATRLFLLLSQILIVSGAVVLERVVKGRIQIAGFAAVMFLYCLPFTWGFLNFEFGVGIALWGIATALMVQERSWQVRLGINTAFVAALFAAHFFALGIYGATIGIYEFWRAWHREVARVETALQLAVLAIPALTLLGLMAATAGSIGTEGNDWFFEFKPLWLFRILNGYNLTVSAASMIALIGFIYVAGKRGVLKLSAAGLWLAIGFIILYLAIPSRLFGTSFVDFRVIAAAAFILPAFITLSPPSRQWNWAALAVVSAITLVNLSVVYFVWLSYRADYSALIGSFGKLDSGSKLLIATSSNGDDPPFDDLTQYPMSYGPTLAVAYANAFVPNLFTGEGKQPVRARATVQRLAIPYGGPVPLAILASIAAGKTAASVPAFIKSWQRDFDYLYVLGSQVANPMPALLEELDRSPRFVLYKIRRQP
jgi:hypothetical protein